MTAPLDLLVFAAHPDDAEIGMGATIAKHTARGLRVGICDLTHAELSSNGDVATRKAEADQAAKELGLAVRTNLGLPDRGLALHHEQIAAIVREIRKFRPRLVFAPYWVDRHPDHVLAGKMVEEAVFNAKLRKYEAEYAPFTVARTYFYFINDIGKADAIVDVSDVYSKKMAALRSFQSQFVLPKESEDMVATPINQGYLERVKARDSLMGQQIAVDYAEGFASRLPILVDLF
ncbi:MAG TPA: bacillithiol biosynthesis deacetylase BshB1 [Bacilli bacterium]